MNHEISLGFLLKVLKKSWWKILIITTVVMLLMATFTVCFIPKKYSSEMRVYVVNVNASYDYTTSSVLSASVYLINDYIAIINSDTMLGRVCAELEAEGTVVGETPDNIRKMLRSSFDEDTSVFNLSVVHTDPDRAYHIAAKIAELAPGVITEIAKPDINNRNQLSSQIYNAMDYYNDGKHNGNMTITREEILEYLNTNNVGLAQQDCIEILNQPQKPLTHDSPNVVTYTLIAGILAVAISYVIFLLSYLTKSVISSEEDVKKMLRHPLIGTIPHWDGSESKK